VKRNILISLIICGTAAVATAMSSNYKKGMHIISPNAVYLEGESCTINMNAERSTESIDEDMFNCALMHHALKQ
jgi:hypothetical protein